MFRNPTVHLITAHLRNGVAVLFATTALTCAEAQTVYVDGALSAASCSTYNPSNRACSDGTDLAYKTFASASAASAPGATIVIRGGTYSEQLRPTKSGSQSATITIRAFAGETVRFTGSPGIDLSGRSYIVIDGVTIEDRSWLEAANANYCVLLNCTFLRTPASGTTGNVRFVGGGHNAIRNCHLESGQDNLIIIDSNYNLIEGNVFAEGRHSLLSLRCSDYNVIRNNRFSNTLQKAMEVYDCGSDTSAAPNSFNSTSRNVIEGNVFSTTSRYYSISAGNGIQYSGQSGIVRFNRFYSCNVGFGLQYYGDEAAYVTDNRIYSNVFHANEGAGVGLSGGALRNVFVNNIVFANRGCAGDCNSTSPGQVVYNGLPSSLRFINNDILYQSAGQPVFEALFDAGQSVSTFSSSHSGVLVGTLELDPKFVNSAAADYTLRSDSPMIDAGAFLTTVSATGSGTSLKVEDASFFTNGFGIVGVPGDRVQLQGQSTAATIVAIDYSTNTLTLDAPLAWTAGLGVSLTYSGSAPDIGAFEYSSLPTTPAAPSNLEATP